MRSARAILMVAGLVGASAGAQTKVAVPSAPTMKPGLWEIVNVNATVGSTAKRTVTAQACFTVEDTRSVAKIIPPQREFGSKCESRDLKVQGETVAWRVACAGKDGTISGPAQVTFAGDTYSGSAKLETKSAGKTTKVDQTFSAKWIGECK